MLNKTKARASLLTTSLAIFSLTTPLGAAHGTTGEAVIYSFAGGTDGSGPIAGVIADKSGALYGTTVYGGGPGCGGYGCGAVFKLAPSASGYTETVLYAFRGGSDGARPFGTLLEDVHGVLYGTTRSGGGGSGCQLSGITGCGTVFRLEPSGSRYIETILHKFLGKDGATPQAGLIADAGGALYGTTTGGGATGYGAVFKLTPRSHKRYAETVLHSFTFSTSDGNGPMGPLIMDAAGNLYGTTANGGDTNCSLGSIGCGTVFELSPSASGYAESILYRFTGIGGDGKEPMSGLARDASGNLYGTTKNGGGGTNFCYGGCGTVFKLTPMGSGYVESIPHMFAYNDGALPQAGVVLSKRNVLYGTTNEGGVAGNGVVYALRWRGSTYEQRILYSFPSGGGQGAVPYDALLERGGTLFGTTFYGGAANAGAVFEIGR